MDTTNTIDPVTERHIKCALDRKAAELGYYFDESAAERVRDFFVKFLRHSKGRKWAGKPFDLLPWEYDDVLAPIFGWKRPDGTRRFHVAYIEVAKKNGKSTLGAGVGIYMEVADGEPGAEVYSVATKREQAAIVHDEAVRMVKKSTGMAKFLRINHTTKTISYEKAEAKYAALASDSEGTEGINPHCLILDEVHAWKDRNFWNTLRYGDVFRDQPLMFMITTAGLYDRTSIGWEQHEYAQKVLDGAVDDLHYFAYIRAADPSDDFTDPAVHAKANPSYGVLIRPEEIAEAVKVASDKPTEWNTLLRYRFSIWTQQLTAWLDMARWDDYGPRPELPHGVKWYGGLDLGSKLDLTAFVLVVQVDGHYVAKAWFWGPRERAIERENTDKVPYITWARQGFMELTPGEVTDYRHVRKRINDLAAQHNLAEIAYDPWTATQLATELREEDGLVMVECRQGTKTLSEPSKLLEALVVDRKLDHNGHPVLRWNANNARVKQDASGNIRPDKDAATDRIDGVVALIMALSRAMVQVETRSVYADRGILTV